MDVNLVKAFAQTGDVLLVHGQSLEQKAIQAATISPYCHVAQLLRSPAGGLLVAEMMEPHGYQAMTLDDWMTTRDASDEIYWGAAPQKVRDNGAAILARQAVYADAAKREYDFSALPLVWLSNITGEEYNPNGEVCSLLVRDNWKQAGYEIQGDPAPGSFLKLCESVSFIRR